MKRRLTQGATLRRPARGAALLAAMLTVTLVAAFAAAAMWQQWRATEVESAERGRVQSAWILVGALDWSRLILQEDARTGGADHLAEPWAVPLEEARLSTFLTAENNVAQVEDASTDTRDAFLSGRITDLQSRLNLRNLIVQAEVQHPALRQFERLFEHLGLPPSELALLVEGLRRALGGQGGNSGSDDGAPLLPQSVEQLGWLGLSPASVARLAPHVVLLPAATPLNLNTASAQVLWAGIEGLDLAGANQLVQARESRHFATLEDAQKLLGERVRLTPTLHGTASAFYEVRGLLRLDGTVVSERSLVHKLPPPARPQVLWRQRGVPFHEAPTP